MKIPKKDYHNVLYILSLAVVVCVIMGGSLTKPVLRYLAESNLERTVVKKTAIDSLDNRIDELLYTVTKIQLQLDKIKNLFSSGEIDESKYRKEKHEVFAKNIYEPLTEMLIIFYRIILFFAAVLIFMSAIISQLIYNSRLLNARIRKLEEICHSREGGNPENFP